MTVDKSNDTNIKKASYDDLDAVKDFVKLSKADVKCQNEHSTSSKDSDVEQEPRHRSDIKIAPPLCAMDTKMHSPSASIEECIIVPTDSYLISEEHVDTSNNHACIDTRRMALDNSDIGPVSPKDSPWLSKISIENICITDGIEEEYNEQQSPEQCLNNVQNVQMHGSVVKSSIGYISYPADKAFGDSTVSNSSDSLALKNLPSSNLDASKSVTQLHLQSDSSTENSYLEHSIGKHTPQTEIQNISSTRNSDLSIPSNSETGLFDRHVIRYNSQALSSKRLSHSKITLRTHEMGNIEIQSFKKFPGFRGSGKMARAPKAVDVLYVAKDTPPSLSGAPHTCNKTSSPLAGALDIIREEQVKTKDTLVVNRFFIGSVPSSVNINDTAEPSDYKSRNLYDMVEKKSSWGKMTTNYIKIVGSKFICYRSKSIRLTENAISDEYFHSPNDAYSYYPEKYALDVRDSQLYVVTGKSIYTSSFCCDYYSASNRNMEEVSNVDIIRITKENSTYSLHVEKDCQRKCILIPNLDFVIYSSGHYRWFRCKNATSLAKWLTVIQMRQKWVESLRE